MSSWPKVRTPFPIIYGLPPEFVDAPLLCFVSVRAPAVLSVGGPWQRRGCVEKALVRADALAPHACARARGLASCDRALARGGGCNASCDRASTGQRATNPPRVGCLWVSLCPMAVCDCRRGARGY